MKRLAKIICLVSVFIMMAASAAMADTIIAGDYVLITYGNYNPDDNAGIMTYDVSLDKGQTTAFTYSTFCIQDNVYIYLNNWYPVASLSNTVGLFGNSNGDGKLNGAVGYLFYRYKSGTGGYDMSTLSNQADFQELLWNLQGTEESGNPFNVSTSTPWYNDYLAYLNPGNNLQHSWGTEVINIATSLSNGAYSGPDIQNQLYNNTDPVPEPTTLLMVGAGLLGIGLLRRVKVSKSN